MFPTIAIVHRVLPVVCFVPLTLESKMASADRLASVDFEVFGRVQGNIKTIHYIVVIRI